MRRWWWSGLLVLLMLMTAALVQAPARLLAWLLPAQQVLASGYAGSLWQGSVARVQVSTPAGPLHLGRVDWRLSPGSLLRLAPALALESAWGGQRLAGQLRLRGPRDWDLADLTITLDATLLRQLAPLELGGQLTASVALLEVRDGLPQRVDAGRLLWQGARWDSPRGPIALGSYVADVAQAGGGTLHGDVLTLQGPVQAAGELQWDGVGYSIDLRIDSEGAWDPLVEDSLALIATPENQGYRLRLSGALAGVGQPPS